MGVEANERDHRPPESGRAAHGVPFLPALAATVVLAVLLGFAAAFVPLHPLDPRLFVSSYGVVDQRALLLGYAGILVAVLLGPLVARAWGKRAPAVSPPSPPSAVEKASVTGPGGARRVAFGIALAFSCFFLLVGPGIAYHPLNGHELVHLGYLNEIDHGRLLNVDTRVTYGPLLGYSLYAFMKWVSFDLVGFRLYWNVAAAVGLWALLFFARGWMRSWTLWALLAGYLLLHTAARFFLADGNGLNGGLWGWANLLRHGWAPLMILALARPLSRLRAAWTWVAAGAIAGLGIAYAQETLSGGAAALAALLVATAEGGSRGRLLRNSGLVFLGGASITAVTLIPALTRGALGDYLTATLEIPRLFLNGGGNLPYPGPFGADRQGVPAWAPYYLLPAFLLGALWWEWSALLDRRGNAVRLALAAYGSVSFVSVLVRADDLHVLNVAAAPILLGFLGADAFLGRRSTRFPPRDRRATAILVPVLFLLPLLAFRPGLPAVARSVVGRLAHLRPAPPAGWERIPGERGGVWTPPGDWFDSKDWGGQDDPDAIPLVRDLSAGHPTYVRGNKASLLYFLSGVPAAVPYTDLSSQCLTPEAYTRLFRALAQSPPETVFLQTETIGPRPRTEDGYRLLGIRHGLEVYRRIDLPPPAAWRDSGP